MEAVQGQEGTRSATARLTSVADGGWEEYLLASSGPIFLAEESWMKKILTGSVCVALIGADTLAAGVYSQEKKDNPAPAKIMHFGDLKGKRVIQSCDLANVAGCLKLGESPF